ncbi:MAG: pyridoxamine 5'-phosphate oxidase family protein [Niabella sp.]|nr:pyridoxamine 5'-phosphate oxidase family protein [Niabella sp.]
MVPDGFPDSRIVSLKEVKDGCFIITGSTNARKGQEIAADNKVGLAFWGPVTGRQVRIEGIARRLQRRRLQCAHRECRWKIMIK